jgi:Flp pilus assembly protein TadG
MKTITINYGNVAAVFLMMIAGTAIAYSDGLNHRSDISNGINVASTTISALAPTSQLDSSMPQTEWDSTTNTISTVSGTAVIQISAVVLLMFFIAFGMYYMRAMA